MRGDEGKGEEQGEGRARHDMALLGPARHDTTRHGMAWQGGKEMGMGGEERGEEERGRRDDRPLGDAPKRVQQSYPISNKVGCGAQPRVFLLLPFLLAFVLLFSAL